MRWVAVVNLRFMAFMVVVVVVAWLVGHWCVLQLLRGTARAHTTPVPNGIVQVCCAA